MNTFNVTKSTFYLWRSAILSLDPLNSVIRSGVPSPSTELCGLEFTAVKLCISFVRFMKRIVLLILSDSYSVSLVGGRMMGHVVRQAIGEEAIDD